MIRLLSEDEGYQSRRDRPIIVVPPLLQARQGEARQGGGIQELGYMMHIRRDFDLAVILLELCFGAFVLLERV